MVRTFLVALIAFLLYKGVREEAGESDSIFFDCSDGSE